MCRPVGAAVSKQTAGDLEVLLVEAGLLQRERAQTARGGDEPTADDIGFPIRRRSGVAHDEADVPIECDVVDPVEQGGARFGIARVIVRPE